MNRPVFCCISLLFVVCVCGLPGAVSFEYNYELNGQLISGKVEHYLAQFNRDSYDVAARLTSMDAIRALMNREHQVDLYAYGVDAHLCSSEFVQPAVCPASGCVQASIVRNWFMQYAGKSILLALRGAPDNCATTNNCLSCTFQRKSQNAFSLNATALVLGQNANANDRVCLMSSDKDAPSTPVVPTALIFNSDYNAVNEALLSLASSRPPPINAWGEVSDDSSNYAVSPAACAAEETPFLFLLIQTGIIPVGVIATIFALKSKLLPQAEEAARQHHNQQAANNNNNQNQQQQQQQQANQNGRQEQQQSQNNEAAPSAGAAGAAEGIPTPGDSHRVTIPSSSSSLEENSSNSFGPAITPSAAIAIADGVELDEFHGSSTRNTRSLPSSGIDDQALLSSDALASDSASSAVSSAGSATRRRMDMEEDFNRRSLIDSHRRLYAVLDFILGFGSPKSLFYGTLLYNLILLMVIEIILVSARDEVCYATDLKWLLVYRAGLCFAAVFHAFGQSFSNIPSVMRLFFYSRAAGIFFSLMFFTTSVSFLVIRRTDADAYPNQLTYDCDARAPLLSSTILPFFLLFLAGGALLVLMRFVDQAYAACTQGRTTVAPAYEGLLVLFGRALRKHFLSGCVLFGPLDQAEPVTTLQLSLLPTATFRVGMYPQDDAVCAICLGNYEAGERLRVLPCHHFHSACLDQWITSQKPTCPTCRRAIPLSYQQYEEANQNDPNVANDNNVRRDGTQRNGRMAVPVEDI